MRNQYSDNEVSVSSNRSDLREFRRKAAESRNVAWNKLSTEAKLADLDTRLGDGVGAVRQREKLQRKLASDLAASERIDAKKEKKASSSEPPKKQERERQKDKKR